MDKPKTNGSTIHRYFFIDENNGWITTTDGTLLCSTNGGDSWQRSWFLPYTKFISICFINKEIGWVSGDNGMLLKTTNHGLSWNQQNKLTGERLNKIKFYNEKNGFILGDTSLFYTSDSGSNWSAIFSNAYRISNFHYLDSNNLWIIFDTKLLKTTNLGKSWTKMYLIDSVDFNAVFFLDEKNGWIGGTAYSEFFKRYCLYYTNDGGNSWNEASDLYNCGTIVHIDFIDSNNGYAYNFGTSYRTENGGKNWMKNFEGGFDQMKQININKNTGWIISVGRASFIYDSYNRWGHIFKTTNNGKTWMRKDTNMFYYDDLTDVFFIDENEGWIVGYGYEYKSHSTIYHTRNGGKNWNMTSFYLDDIKFRKVHFFNKDVGYVYGSDYGMECDVLLKTTNSGETWEYRYRPSGAIQFVNENLGYSVTYEGYVSKTTNGGDTWVEINHSGKYPVEFMRFFDENFGWVNSSSALFYTTDGGRNWSISESIDKYQYFNDIFFIDRDNGWVCKSSKGIYKTTDGGKNWRFIETDASGTKIFFADKNNGWIAGTYTYATTDGGENWEIQHSGCTSLFFNDINTGWCVGIGGMLCKYSETSTNIVNYDKELNNKFSLSPNPASNFIEITSSSINHTLKEVSL